MTITPYELLKELNSSVDFWGSTTGFTSDQLCEALTYAVSTIDAQAARIAELQAERGRLDRESQALSNQLGDCDRLRLAAQSELAALRERKPDVFISKEGADAIKAIMNREMSGAGRYVSFERTGLGRGGMLGLFIQPVPAAPVASLDGFHPDTAALVNRFAIALAEKLYAAQIKYDYDADWQRDDWKGQCLEHFHQHIAKGDPRDVAAYCAFMWHHGWSTAAAPVAVPDDVNSGELYRIANHIAGAKESLPVEWQPWAEDVEDSLRKLLRLNSGRKPE